jgi:spore coat protein U-like protein
MCSFVASNTRRVEIKFVRGLAVILAVMLSGSAFGSTTTTTFQSQITITANCTILSAATLNFGSQGILTANVDQTSAI